MPRCGRVAICASESSLTARAVGPAPPAGPGPLASRPGGAGPAGEVLMPALASFTADPDTRGSGAVAVSHGRA